MMPKIVIPKLGWFSSCQDTEGNNFGISGFGNRVE